MSSPDSPLPCLEETHLLILVIYFFSVLSLSKKTPQPNLLSKDLLPMLILARLRRISYTPVRQKKGNPLQPSSIQA